MSSNRILASLPPEELAAVEGMLTTVALASGEILYAQGSRIEAVYFPDTAVASLISRMEDGGVVEVGTIGNEGLVGLNVSLGSDVSLRETLIQIPGNARRMSVADFRGALAEMPGLRNLTARCTIAFMNQVSQTAACNGLHGIEQRCARWLLLTHDRLDDTDSFPLTHQFLSLMLGVRRAGVTQALGALTKAKTIRSTRGTITIVDRGGLESLSCECYAALRHHAGSSFAA